MVPRGRKPKAFVIMPFDDEFNTVYEKLIVPPLQQIGFDVRRADTDLNQQNILKDVVKGIADASLVVADLTDLDPNVFYELGIAHGLNKKAVLLTQSIESLPFDLQSYRVIEYSRIFDKAFDLIDALETVGRGFVSGETRFGSPVSDFLGVEPGEPVGPEAVAPVLAAPRRTARKKKERLEKELAERGPVDWLADIEKSMTTVSQSVQRMGGATVHLGQQLTSRTEQLQSEQASTGMGRALRIQAIVRDAASDLLTFAEGVGKELPAYRRAWKRFSEAAVDLLTSDAIKASPDKGEVRELRPHVVKLLEGLSVALESIQTMRKTTLGLQGTSSDLTRASRRAVDVLDALITEWKASLAMISRIIVLIDELSEASS